MHIVFTLLAILMAAVWTTLGRVIPNEQVRLAAIFVALEILVAWLGFAFLPQGQLLEWLVISSTLMACLYAIYVYQVARSVQSGWRRRVAEARATAVREAGPGWTVTQFLALERETALRAMASDPQLADTDRVEVRSMTWLPAPTAVRGRGRAALLFIAPTEAMTREEDLPRGALTVTWRSRPIGWR